MERGLGKGIGGGDSSPKSGAGGESKSGFLSLAVGSDGETEINEVSCEKRSLTRKAVAGNFSLAEPSGRRPAGKII